MSTKRTSISDYSDYRSICNLMCESDETFKTFKQHPTYTAILEHASKEQAEKCISLIMDGDIDKSKIKKLRENDEQGQPTVYEYGNPLFDGMSPSTIRYIKVLSDMIDIYTNLDNFKIVEIGVGYGGQCKILCDYFNIESYDLVDLPEVLKLTEKYLSKYEYKNVNSWDNKPEYDLVISNYAITECDREIQQYYIDNILKNAKHGYITCNYISDRFDISSMHQNEFISSIGLEKYYLIDENPLTFPGNKVLIW